MWQQLAAGEFAKVEAPRLRFSGASRCIRSQTYAAMGMPESDPADEQALNRMRLGHVLEVLIVMGLEQRGWETQHTTISETGQLTLSATLPRSGVEVSGHPDGICRHPSLTRGQWVTLECKSMSPTRADETMELGVAATYPHYISQIALYGQQLQRMGLTDHPTKGVFAMMDREGRPMPPERVSWAEDEAQNALETMDQAALFAQDGRLPERPYAVDSVECRFCPHRSRCWEEKALDPVIDRNAWNRSVPAGPEEAEAARAWREANPVVKAARAVLQEAVDRSGGGTLEAEGVLASYFIPRNEPKYDQIKLERLIPAELLRQCLLPQEGRVKRTAFWVREKRE